MRYMVNPLLTMKNKILLFLFLFVSCSCTPQRRLERFQKLHPYLFTKINDTITYRDIIRVDVPELQLSNKIEIPKKDTTISFYKENIEAIFSFTNDSVDFKITSHRKSIDVPIEIDVPVPRWTIDKARKTTMENIKNFAVSFFILFILLTVYKTVKNISDKSKK